MSYAVHVQGRANDMVFSTFTSAENYRRVMLAAGLFARLA